MREGHRHRALADRGGYSLHRAAAHVARGEDPRCGNPAPPATVARERAEEYGHLNAGAGMLVVRITPEKIVSEGSVLGTDT